MIEAREICHYAKGENGIVERKIFYPEDLFYAEEGYFLRKRCFWADYVLKIFYVFNRENRTQIDEVVVKIFLD